MCFSPIASFTAASALGATGGATLSLNKNRRLAPIAIVPLLFGIQQALEGVVWLKLLAGQRDILFTLTSYGFIFFAYIFWPVFGPWAILKAETNDKRKHWIRGCLYIGSAVSLYLLIWIIVNMPQASIINHSINYNIDVQTGGLISILYVLAVCGSALFSSYRWIKIFGALLLISLAFAVYFYTATLASVWCFFAAALAGVIALFVVIHNKKPIAETVSF